MSSWTFSVLGEPIPKGSTRAFVKNGRAVTTAANPRTKSWERDIRAVLQSWPHGLIEGPVYVGLSFTIARPASVSEKKRPEPTVKPDLDKLTRNALDAMSGVIFLDDAQVTVIDAQKNYGPKPGLSGVISW